MRHIMNPKSAPLWKACRRKRALVGECSTGKEYDLQGTAVQGAGQAQACSPKLPSYAYKREPSTQGGNKAGTWSHRRLRWSAAGLLGAPPPPTGPPAGCQPDRAGMPSTLESRITAVPRHGSVRHALMSSPGRSKCAWRRPLLSYGRSSSQTSAPSRIPAHSRPAASSAPAKARKLLILRSFTVSPGNALPQHHHCCPKQAEVT